MELPWRVSAVPKRNTSASEPSLLPPARSQPDFYEACELIRTANADEIKFYEDILQNEIFENVSHPVRFGSDL